MLFGGAFSIYIVSIRYENFIANQQQIAKHALKSTANEIENYITHSRHLANILVSNHQQLIQSLAQNKLSTHALKAATRFMCTVGRQALV